MEGHKINIIRSIDQIKNHRKDLEKHQSNIRIALVPTMGYLHEGHISLIQKAKEVGTYVIVSIFVNPLQFNDLEDLNKYPKNIERDIKILKQEKVDLVFIPEASEVIPKKNYIQITAPLLINQLCGNTRLNHFDGMLYIVHNLFMWIKPHIACFGLKDYQQYKLVALMNQELQMNVKIIPVETVREKTGLALSSRNARLSSQGKINANILWDTLKMAKDELSQKNTLDSIRYKIISHLKPYEVDYANIFNSETLQPISEYRQGQTYLVALAVWIEQVRLIDNILITL